MDTCDKGDRIRINGEFTKATVYTDPTLVTLKIRTPSGTTTSYAYPAEAQKLSAGRYWMEYSVAEAGLYHYQWKGTSPAEGVYNGTFFARDEDV